MTIHEGELPTSSTHIKVRMQLSGDRCKIFELATTQLSNCDIAVDKLYKAIVKLDHITPQCWTRYTYLKVY